MVKRATFCAIAPIQDDTEEAEAEAGAGAEIGAGVDAGTEAAAGVKVDARGKVRTATDGVEIAAGKGWGNSSREGEETAVRVGGLEKTAGRMQKLEQGRRQ